MNSRTVAWVSVVLLLVCLGGLLFARPYIQSLVEEAYLDLDLEAEDTEAATSLWRKQRIVAAKEMDALAAVELLRAQKEEGIEDMDTDFVTSFELLAPPGFVLGDDYDDEETIDTASGEDEVAGWGQPPQSRRNISSRPPGISRPGQNARSSRKSSQGNTGQRQGAQAVSGGSVRPLASRHSGFALRRRRYQPLAPPPQPPSPPQPAPVEVGVESPLWGSCHNEGNRWRGLGGGGGGGEASLSLSLPQPSSFTALLLTGSWAPATTRTPIPSPPHLHPFRRYLSQCMRLSITDTHASFRMPSPLFPHFSARLDWQFCVLRCLKPRGGGGGGWFMQSLWLILPRHS